MDGIEAFRIIHTRCVPGTLSHYYLICHGEAVARKAFEIADRPALAEKNIDRNFLYTASMLHDIGMLDTDAPEIGCTGPSPYIMHGILGARYLRSIGYEGHARVAEVHIGSGITGEEIRSKNLPLPDSDFIPETLEEKIICVADKFHSKVTSTLTVPKSFEIIMERLPESSRQRFLEFAALLDEPGYKDFL